MRQEFDLLRSLPLDWLMKIAMAVVCGAIIGIERQLRRKTAGMRTNVMICLGAALYYRGSLHTTGGQARRPPNRQSRLGPPFNAARVAVEGEDHAFRRG